MLIQLTWQLDKVARHRSARHGRIADITQHLMQRMAKFMKQGARIVELQKRSRITGRLGEIAHIDNNGSPRAWPLTLALQSAAPGAGSFALSLIHI